MTDSKTALEAKNKPLASGGPALWLRLRLWLRRTRILNKLEGVFAALAVVSATVTIVSLATQDSLLDLRSDTELDLLFSSNLVLLLALGVMVGRWFVRAWSARQTGRAGGRLYSKVTGIFMVIAVLPTIIMALFSVFILQNGFQSWFGDRIRVAVENSISVAESYVAENRAMLQNDLSHITRFFERYNAEGLAITNSQWENAAIDALDGRNLNEVILIEDWITKVEVVARADNGLDLRTTRLLPEHIARLRQGDSFVLINSADKNMIGFSPLSGFLRPTYLFISRDLDPKVLKYYSATRKAVADYRLLESQRGDFQRQFGILFIVIALLILMASIWAGLRFAARLATPLSELVTAADKVGEGDFNVRVPNVHTTDEIGSLSRAFNRMTRLLAINQDRLIETNIELDERRSFLEAVLESISAGVIGLTRDGTVYLNNRSAHELLGLQPDQLENQQLAALMPSFQPLLEQLNARQVSSVQGQVSVDVNGEMRILLVRISSDGTRDLQDDQKHGSVITFDDLTEQLADQRTAAWAGVARRIAHEIKNPLTPIQLSAERIGRRTQHIDAENKEVVGQCIQTIVRQVGDLRRMVDEFSGFARMPAPIYRPTDLNDAARQALFLIEVANTDVNYHLNEPARIITADCDGRLLGQAIANVVKNATESVQARMNQQHLVGKTVEPGLVELSLEENDENIRIVIIDNGLGLPEGQKDRLTDPYVTTREKGTGLGLAIVKRIVEEHGGRVRLSDRQNVRGARAVLVFSKTALSRRAEAQALADYVPDHPAGDTPMRPEGDALRPDNDSHKRVKAASA